MVTSAMQTAIAQAQVCEKQTGLWTSLTVAQWGLESGFGAHCPGNNPFGIKYSPATSPSSQLLWTTEIIYGKPQRVQAKFAAYPTLAAAFADHARLLTHGSYLPAWIAYKNDSTPDRFIAAFAPIYATDPLYQTKMESIINEYRLKQYDRIALPLLGIAEE